MHCNNMAVTGISFRQRAVIEFLVKEGNSAGFICELLHGVYGDACMGASSVRRWVKQFRDGKTDIADEPHCGRPRTAATERIKQKFNELIRQDRRITVREIAAQLGVGRLMRQSKKQAVRSWLRGAGTDFFRRGIFKILQHWQKRIDRDGHFVEK
jgi:transposase